MPDQPTATLPGARPLRLQRSRAKGSRLVSPNGLPVVCVTRGTRYGNPFAPGKRGPMDRTPIDREGSLGFFRMMLRDPQLRAAAGYPSDDDIRRDLSGKNLACWCGLNEACHADELLRIASLLPNGAGEASPQSESITRGAMRQKEQS